MAHFVNDTSEHSFRKKERKHRRRLAVRCHPNHDALRRTSVLGRRFSGAGWEVPSLLPFHTGLHTMPSPGTPERAPRRALPPGHSDVLLCPGYAHDCLHVKATGSRPKKRSRPLHSRFPHPQGKLDSMCIGTKYIAMRYSTSTH